MWGDPYYTSIALDNDKNILVQSHITYRERRTWDNHKNWIFTANIKVKLDLSNNKLYYLNQMPLEFDRNDENKNKSN
jgi:hypothetical protein